MAIKVHFMISLLSWHAQQVGATCLWEMCETAQRRHFRSANLSLASLDVPPTLLARADGVIE
jgi:hypothetical protein